MILRSHTRQSKLPPELIDRIIDYLHDCPADLSACSCVCRAWLESSRFHIFYSISIQPTGDRKTSGSMLSKCQKLSRIIQRCPGVALHVRELHFSVGFRLGKPGSSIKLKVEKLLPPLLQSFTRLRKLDIFKFEWTDLTPDIRKSLYRLLSLPSLVQFEVVSVDFNKLDNFTNLLQPHLKQLTLSALWRMPPQTLATEVARTLDAEDEERTLPHQQPCRIESLTFDFVVDSMSSQFIDWLLGSQSIIDVSNIRTLDVLCHPYSERYSAMKLICGLGSSLEHLTFRHRSRLLWNAESIRLGSQHNLRTLSFFAGSFPTTTALFCTHVLSNVIAPNLEKVYIDINILHEPDNWQEVDRALDSQVFGSLRNVEVLLTVDGFEEEIRRKFTDQFPLVMSRGLLNVRTRYEAPCANRYQFWW